MIDPRALDAVVFDYGNTLIEYARAQIAYCDGELERTLAELYGPVDSARLRRIRDDDRKAPYVGEMRENDLAPMTAAMVRNLTGRDPSAAELERLLACRYRAFVESITCPEYLHGFLAGVKRHYRVGLLSNYPCGRALRASLRRTGIEPYIDGVVVSGDVGFVKPHPRPFAAILEALGVGPRRTLFVGDNWLGDVQGAKRAGMACAFITQWDTPEVFPREEGDHAPDLVVSHLLELGRHLNLGAPAPAEP